MVHITLLAYPNCSMTGIAGAIDAFSIANFWWQLCSEPDGSCRPLFQWDIVTMDGKPVQGRGRVAIQPHCSILDVNSTEFILIPGFLPPLEFIGNVPKKLQSWLWDRYEKKVMIGSTCTGAFLLAETGLLNNRTATTNWSFAGYFQKLYPKVRLKPERMITEDNGIVCSGATTSFLDLCLHLIEKFGSEELAFCCSKSLLIEPNRHNQSPFFMFNYQKKHTDEKIFKAQIHLEKKFTEAISVEMLASNLGFSPRNFKRRFKRATGDSPLVYLQRIRIEAAKQKLESTKETIDEITGHVGYEDSNSFRKLFKKFTGLSPREYRERFSRIHKA